MNTTEITDMMQGSIIVEKEICQVKYRKDKDGVTFYLNDSPLFNTYGNFDHKEIEIIRSSLENSYKQGWLDASSYMMNKK